MIRVDFAFGAPNRLRMACEVLRKHCDAGRRVLVFHRNPQQLQRFDGLLWGFDSTAFVPHAMADDALARHSPVILCATPDLLDTGLAAVKASEGAPPDSGPPWVLNLDDECPPRPERFGRVLEIVSDREDDRASARRRWKQYQAAGHEVRAHDVSGR